LRVSGDDFGSSAPNTLLVRKDPVLGVEVTNFEDFKPLNLIV
jgi:hypothetical protein